MLTKMTEEDWVLVLEVFHACRSRRGDKGRDDHKFLEALHCFTVHNVTWRALPAEFGSWNSIWKRFWRLRSGVFEFLSKRIVLIDGEQLTKLMIRHNVGCRVEDTLQTKRIDEDFYTNVERCCHASTRQGIRLRTDRICLGSLTLLATVGGKLLVVFARGHPRKQGRLTYLTRDKSAEMLFVFGANLVV